MTYFEDQEQAWFDNNCEGRIEDMDPYMFWADRISECEARGHAKIKIQTIEDDDGKSKYKAKVCQFCEAILEKL